METLVEHGLVVSGISPDGKFVEMVELEDHPWFLGCQFHPEYKSKPFDPHPLFVSYIRAACEASLHKRAEDQRLLGQSMPASGPLPGSSDGQRERRAPDELVSSEEPS
jgi:hypothetical protein